jgi:hypothetical protein
MLIILEPVPVIMETASIVKLLLVEILAAKTALQLQLIVLLMILVPGYKETVIVLALSTAIK